MPWTELPLFFLHPGSAGKESGSRPSKGYVTVILMHATLHLLTQTDPVLPEVRANGAFVALLPVRFAFPHWRTAT